VGLFYPFILFLLTYIVYLQRFFSQKSIGAVGGKTNIYIKRRYLRFGFGTLGISQILIIRQKQSNGNAPWVYYTPLSAHTSSVRVGTWCLYTFHVGLSALLVSTDWAMREPSECGTSKSAGSTFFCVYV
jgi:heme/copper-type cytochrome/quinol oxidase subunit 1